MTNSCVRFELLMNRAFVRHAPAYAVLCFFLLCGPAARANWFDQGPLLSISEENDAFLNSDRYYTQGLRFTYLHSDNHLPDWMRSVSDAIPAFGYTVHALRIGTQVGQDIYTPDEINTNGFRLNERPYAGWLYTGFILQRKGRTDGGRPVLENFQMDIGIIGPASLADETQAWAHNDRSHILGKWTDQLKNEPGLALKYQRSVLFSPGAEGEARHFDFIPHAGFSLGNVEISLRAGGLVRAGFHLPDDFGPQTIHSLASPSGGRSPGQKNGRHGFYAFLSAEGRAVAYNAFLDGNLWKPSPHVTKEPLVGEFTGGVTAIFPYCELAAFAAYRTHEFTLQETRAAYAGLTLKFKL